MKTIKPSRMYALSRWLPEPLRMQFAERSARKAFAQELQNTPTFDGFSNVGMTYQNPDPLVDRKGLAIYDEMDRRDDMVAASAAFLIYGAISTGGAVVPCKNPQPVDLEAAAFAQAQTQKLKGSFVSTQLDMYHSAVIGFSLLEKSWRPVETQGRWVGRQFMDRLAPRNPVNIGFKLDKHGDIKKNGIVQTPHDGTSAEITIDLSRVVHHVFDSRFNNPYGRSPLQRAYRYWYIKEGAIKLWARDMERFGLPMVFGRVPGDADDDDISEMREFLRRLRDSLVGVFRPGWEVKFLERKVASSRTFLDAITMCNRGIARSYFLPALVLESTETGAYSLGKSHSDQFEWILYVIRDGGQETINTQFLEEVVGWNFQVEDFPQYQYNAFRQEDLVAKAGVMKLLGDIGLPLSVPWLREEFHIPAPEKDEETLAPKPAKEGYKVPGMDETQAAAYSELIFDAAHGKLGPRKTVTFGERKPRKRERTDFEALFDFESVNEQDENGEAVTQENMGVAFEAIARDVETLVAERSGDRSTT